MRKSMSVFVLLCMAFGQVWASDVAQPHKLKVAYKHKSSTKIKPQVLAPQVLPPVAAVKEPPMEPARLAISDQVHTGRMPCELGNTVTVTPDDKNTGYFFVQMKNHTFHMSPVPTTTGAVRLEDNQAGALWIQLANKSMLMNTQLGQRMADECQSPAQVAVSENMKLNPPKSLLDGPEFAKK